MRATPPATFRRTACPRRRRLFTDLSHKLARYSPKLATAESNAQISQLMGDIRQARELGPELAEFTKQRSRMDRSLQKMETNIEKIALGSFINPLLKALNDGGDSLSRNAIWPYGINGPIAGFDGTLGVIARLDSDLAQAITLIPVAGTPAALNGPLTFTANKAILSEANDIDILLGPDERDIPVLFNLLLYDSGGIKRFFQVT